MEVEELMTVRLRLQRLGKPKRPFYRLVAIDQASRRDGKPVEVLGQYDPMADTEKIKVNRDRIDYWIKQGAQCSETVADLLKLKKASAPVPSKKSEAAVVENKVEN
jgi:small subunit ribosomal protein S16